MINPHSQHSQNRVVLALIVLAVSCVVICAWRLLEWVGSWF